MKTGCLTLELWHCSRQLELLKVREDKDDGLALYLSAVISTVNSQLGILSSQ